MNRQKAPVIPTTNLDNNRMKIVSEKSLDCLEISQSDKVNSFLLDAIIAKVCEITPIYSDTLIRSTPSHTIENIFLKILFIFICFSRSSVFWLTFRSTIVQSMTIESLLYCFIAIINDIVIIRQLHQLAMMLIEQKGDII